MVILRLLKQLRTFLTFFFLYLCVDLPPGQFVSNLLIHTSSVLNISQL
jgi:hypothetical protein